MADGETDAGAVRNLASFTEVDEHINLAIDAFDNYCSDLKAAFDDKHQQIQELVEERQAEYEAQLAEVAALKAQANIDIVDERKQFEEDKKAFEDEKAAMKDVYKFQKQKVKLDIGGHTFSTSRKTLSSVGGSFFASMFSGSYPLEQDDDGSYFIDRDGRHFHYILNFLREKESFEAPSSPLVLKELLKEAEFYSLHALKDVLVAAAGGPGQVQQQPPPPQQQQQQHAFQYQQPVAQEQPVPAAREAQPPSPAYEPQRQPQQPSFAQPQQPPQQPFQVEPQHEPAPAPTPAPYAALGPAQNGNGLGAEQPPPFGRAPEPAEHVGAGGNVSSSQQDEVQPPPPPQPVAAVPAVQPDAPASPSPASSLFRSGPGNGAAPAPSGPAPPPTYSNGGGGAGTLFQQPATPATPPPPTAAASSLFGGGGSVASAGDSMSGPNAMVGQPPLQPPPVANEPPTWLNNQPAPAEAPAPTPAGTAPWFPPATSAPEPAPVAAPPAPMQPMGVPMFSIPTQPGGQPGVEPTPFSPPAQPGFGGAPIPVSSNGGSAAAGPAFPQQPPIPGPGSTALTSGGQLMGMKLDTPTHRDRDSLRGWNDPPASMMAGGSSARAKKRASASEPPSLMSGAPVTSPLSPQPSVFDPMTTTDEEPGPPPVSPTANSAAGNTKPVEEAPEVPLPPFFDALRANFDNTLTSCRKGANAALTRKLDDFSRKLDKFYKDMGRGSIEEDKSAAVHGIGKHLRAGDFAAAQQAHHALASSSSMDEFGSFLVGLKSLIQAVKLARSRGWKP